MDFAQRDLAVADLRAVTTEIHDFFTVEPGLVGGKAESLDVLLAIQRETWGMLRRLSRDVPTDQRRAPVILDLKLQIWIFRNDTMRPAERDYRVTKSVNGPLRDRFLFRVLELLEEFGTENLRVCPRPGCDRVFFKVTKKEYCSTKCQARDYMRKNPQYRMGTGRRSAKGGQRGKTTRKR